MDLRKPGSGTLFIYLVGVSNVPVLSVLTILGRRPVTGGNAQTESGGAESARNTPGSLVHATVLAGLSQR